MSKQTIGKIMVAVPTEIILFGLFYVFTVGFLPIWVPVASWILINMLIIGLMLWSPNV